MPRKPTLADVAKAAGLSPATVDRVINARGGVDAAKEERVLRVARELGLDRRLDYTHRAIKRIAVLIQPPSNPFHAELARGFDAVRNLMSALNIQISVSHIDLDRPARTTARIRALPGLADGLVICAPAGEGVAEALREISGRLPVVTLASDIEPSGRVAFIGPDDLRAGRVAAGLMALHMGPRGGGVLMLAGRFDIAGQQARATGFEQGLARAPDIWIETRIETNENADVTAHHIYRALADAPDIRGIYHLSVGSVGIVSALEKLGRGHDVSVITHEMTPNRARLLRNRQLCAVLDQEPLLEARLAIETLARAFGRLDGAVASVETPVRIYLPDSL